MHAIWTVLFRNTAWDDTVIFALTTSMNRITDHIRRESRDIMPAKWEILYVSFCTLYGFYSTVFDRTNQK